MPKELYHLDPTHFSIDFVFLECNGFLEEHKVRFWSLNCSYIIFRLVYDPIPRTLRANNFYGFKNIQLFLFLKSRVWQICFIVRIKVWYMVNLGLSKPIAEKNYSHLVTQLHSSLLYIQRVLKLCFSFHKSIHIISYNIKTFLQVSLIVDDFWPHAVEDRWWALKYLWRCFQNLLCCIIPAGVSWMLIVSPAKLRWAIPAM